MMHEYASPLSFEKLQLAHTKGQLAAFESSDTHLRLSRCAVVDVRTVGLTQFGRVRDLESCSVAFWWVLRISLARRLPSRGVAPGNTYSLLLRSQYSCTV